MNYVNYNWKKNCISEFINPLITYSKINKQKFKLKEIHQTPKISRSTWMSLDIIHFTIMVDIRISITTFQIKKCI